MKPVSYFLEQIDALHRIVPGADAIAADLIHPQSLRRLKLAGPENVQTLARLRAAQRILRIAPDPTIAATLLSEGLSSAHQIAVMARSRFVSEIGSKLGADGETIARRVYDRSLLIKTRVSHLVTSLRQSIGSPYFRACAGYNVGDDLDEYFQTLSSYQALFGSLNYCDAGNDPTILSPAAYLVDLLRVIDLAITQPNSTIPPGLTLNARRPDLGNISLTGVNTFDEVPYLQIVDEILTQTVGTALSRYSLLLDSNVFLTLANLYYPFNLPYHRPLDRLRTYLAAKSVTLAQVYGAFNNEAPKFVEHAEYLRLSFEQVRNLALSPESALAQTVSKNYGLTISAGNLADMNLLAPFMAQTGISLTDVGMLLVQDLSAKEIFDTSGSYQTSGLSTSLTLKQSSDQVTGTFDQDGTLNALLVGTVLTGYWQNSTEAGDFQLDFAADGASFVGKWRVGYSGDWNSTPWNGSRPASSVTAGIIPHSFFINKPLAVREYLDTVLDIDSVTAIDNQCLGTLDTINRFVRLAAYLGWSYQQLNWVLNTLNAPSVDESGNLTCTTELTSDTLIELAKVQRLLDAGMHADVASAMWFDIRTIGCGTTEVSTAPFDVVFNNPAALAQFPNRSVYHPLIPTGTSSYVNPLYTDDALKWTASAQVDGSEAAAVVSCIPTNVDDLTAIAVAAFGAGATVPLTVSNLSVLYRHAMLASFLNLRTPAYLGLLQAVGLSDGTTLPAIFTRDQVLAVLDNAGWIQASGIGVPNLNYLMTGTASVYATPGYQPDAIPALLANLDTTLKATLLGPDAFVSPQISGAQSAAYTQVLINSGYLDPLGVVLKDAVGTPPDLSSASLYDPTVKTPSSAQLAIVVQGLTKAAKNQLNATSQQLATFFGAKAETLAVTLAGAAIWQNLPGPVEPFLLAPLFSVPATTVQTGGLPDIAKLTTAFAANGITLRAGTTVVPQTAASWSISDSKNTYQVVSPDLVGMAYYDAGSTLLFRGLLADVQTDGTIDPAKVASAFATAGLPLTGTPTITLAAAPLSFAVADPASGVVYRATQRGDAAAPLDVLEAATLPATPPATASAMVLTASQMLVLTKALPLSNTALEVMMQIPSAFGFTVSSGAPVSTPLAAINAVYVFTGMVSAFHDNNDGFAHYLTAAQQELSPASADEMLCKVTSWDISQCTFVRNIMFGSTTAATTVAMIAGLKRAFDLCAAAGIDAYTLYSLTETAQAPADATHFAAADALAGQLLESLRASTQPAAWPTVYEQINGPLLERQRDALVPIAISQLRQTYSDITTPDSLYEYLLIDVEMSGCAHISVVKEALNAAQLYLQRCRLNLERNVVISTENLPEVWWEWLLNYRVWQANREIFLYPENYLDPTLRQGKTELFRNLENGLLQGDVTANRVDEEFRKYLNGLSELAQLKIVDACRAVVHDEEKGDIDTLFLFARTTTQPYKFYTTSRQILGDCSGINAAEWTQWLPVSITINAKLATAVYAFNRLMLFWSELSSKQELDGTGDANKRATITTLTVKYSFQNFSGDWVQPQTLIDELPVDVTGVNPNVYGPFSDSFNHSPDVMWNKVGCLRTPASAFPADPASSEKLCIYFGPLIDKSSGDGTAAPDPTKYAANPAVAQFCAQIDQAALIRDQLNGCDLTGQTSLFPVTVIDATLQPSPLLFENQYLILKGDTPAADAAPAFIVGLNGNSLVAASALNSLVDDYIEGMGVNIPPFIASPNTVVITEQSFVNDYVSTDQSQQFYTILTTPPNDIIDSDTHTVKQVITNLTLPMLATTLQTTQGIARQVREVLLDAYFSSLVLLSGVGSSSASVMPVSNQPGSFIVADGTQVFLIEARPPQETYPPMIDVALTVTTEAAIITPATLITRDIDADQASLFYTALSTPPNDVIGKYGKVNTQAVQNLSVQMIASVLTTDLGRAQEVRNILLSGSGPSAAAYCGAGFANTDSIYTLQFEVSRLTTSAIENLSAALEAGGIATLLALRQQQLPTDAAQPFSDLQPISETIPIGPSAGQPVMLAPECYFGRQVDFEGPFGQYYWELFFHAPLLVAKMLHDNQRFAEAETWLQYIFNPTLPPSPLTEARFVTLRPKDVSASEAKDYYEILTTPPNQLIDADGNVLPAALQVTPAMLASLLSVAPPRAMEIKNLLVNQYLPKPLLTEARFVTLRPNDVSAADAKEYYEILTTPPNQLIDTDGNVLPAALKVTPAMLATLLSVPLTRAVEIKDLLVNQYLAKPTGHYWQFQPFRNHTLESLHDQLTNCAEIAAYNDTPFDPDAIARLRIGAYEKAVVIAYIKNLLAWGDAEFSQYTWETITTARMLYSYASDLLGPRPIDVDSCSQAAPTTFNIILAQYGNNPEDIPQFLIEIENAVPPMAVGGPLLSQVGKPFNDLGGVFVAPENDRLIALWDLVADRVGKIRNCLNIDGQRQPLPLFEPAIDPTSLIRAAASGNNLLAVTDQLQPKLPYYRFATVIQRALDTTELTRAFGTALLAALQAHDAEALAAMMQTNAVGITQMTTLVKRKAVEDLNDQIEALQQGLANATYRKNHYNSLISAGLNAAETAALTLMSAALVAHLASIAFNGLSIAGYLAPNIFGLADGGMEFGNAIYAGAQIAGTEAEILSQSAGISTTVADYQRRTQDWQLQAALADFDIAQISSDVAATAARLSGAQHDLAVTLQQIKDDQQELTFLKTKFTNEDLYSWTTGRLGTLYFQAYRIAQELALQAQTAYQYELDRDDQFITFAYWDNLRRGLLAGEGLALALTQLQKAYADNNVRRLEIEKTVSLRQTCPMAFIGFRWGFTQGASASTRGQLDFVLSEALFDFDFPSHYCRKIKSISISIPCLVGPYQDLHATLTQNFDATALSPDIAAVQYLAKRTSAGMGDPAPPPAGSVRQNWVTGQQIAISQGLDDAGLFVLDFNDERYLPFEGTGAVSSWSFSLPPDTNLIDFDSISDVIVKIRYTARDGGAAFGQQVKQFYIQQAANIPRLLNATFGLAHSFPAQWFQAMHTAPVNQTQTISFPVGDSVVLPNLSLVKLNSVLLQLELADGSAVSDVGGKSFITLRIDRQDPSSVAVPISNNFGHVDGGAFGPGPFTGVTWSVVFDLANTPPELLTNGVLDPDKLIDIAVVITYSAAPF
ncbi:neuraminidase-like domain-containing protein [Burkholderia ubonensis]|uniref:Tc toxin subunit A-related protein n=1 Tax=Burkholderia ubonensis TaxID=101571 RepID=UPI000752D4F7|nr:neuraminidase-like domain-containing protein [Burkholderia ubonensis]KVK96224.1 hypothetical protein WJ45_20135 [Burkholderia ubonensis]KVQ44355.1 hypothetical protein WK04_15640 [Burkholderia ubonensis]